MELLRCSLLVVFKIHLYLSKPYQCLSAVKAVLNCDQAIAFVWLISALKCEETNFVFYAQTFRAVPCCPPLYSQIKYIKYKENNNILRANAWIINYIINQITISSQHNSSKVVKEWFKLNKPMHQATSHVRYSKKETASQKLQTFWEAEFNKYQITN